MEEMIQDAPESGGSSNRTVVMVLVAVIVLLAVVVGYFAFTSGKTPEAESTGSTESTATAGMPGTPASTVFDPATATKVPAGEEPEQYVTAYFDAVVAGDYKTAYERLPADKRAGQDEAAFASQLAGYGVSSYTIDDVTVEGDEARVTATASMAGGDFQYLWTFVKDGEGWLVKSRTLPGMGQ